jgi:hypothetical protein
MSKLVSIPLPPGWRDVSGGLPYELTRFVPEGSESGGVLEIAPRPDLQGKKRPLHHSNYVLVQQGLAP